MDILFTILLSLNFTKVDHDWLTPPKTNMDTLKWWALEKVTPALNTAIFGIYIKFLRCRFSLPPSWQKWLATEGSTWIKFALIFNG